MTQERIGVIGLGLIGKPVARNLLRAGYTVTVYNRSQAAVLELTAAGAQPAASPAALAAQSDVVITSLPDSPDVEDVVTRADGVLAGAHPGTLLIDTSTVAPATSRRLAELARAVGVRALDATVSGGDIGAINATLSIMVGGAAEDLARAMPVLRALGTTITHCGGPGAGQVVKACNQLVVALVIEAVSEAFVLGTKAGVDPQVIAQVLGGGLAQTRFMDLRAQKMSARDFAPGGKARFHRKDLGIVLQLAREYGVALPATALVDQLFTPISQLNGAEYDHSALLLVIESLAAQIAGPPAAFQ